MLKKSTSRVESIYGVLPIPRVLVRAWDKLTPGQQNSVVGYCWSLMFCTSILLFLAAITITAQHLESAAFELGAADTGAAAAGRGATLARARSARAARGADAAASHTDARRATEPGGGRARGGARARLRRAGATETGSRTVARRTRLSRSVYHAAGEEQCRRRG